MNTNMDGAGNGRLQGFRAGYTNANDRASIDGATALGNLAYASSLGRDSAIQQVANNNRQQSNANYGTASPYGVGSAPKIQYRTGDERRDSRGSSREENTRSQQATASPSFGYSTNNVAYHGSSAGSNTQAQPQFSQQSRSSTEQLRNQYSQPSRPLSGQAMQQSHSVLGSQAAPSPTLPATQSTPNQAQVSKSSGSVRGKEQTRVHTPQTDKRQSSSQVSKGPTQKPQVPQATANPPVESATKEKAAAYASAKETAAKGINEVRQSPDIDTRRDQASTPATPAEPQYTTVDPSQVFNHFEYSRRQAAAAVEAAAAKQAAEEAEAARFAATQPKPATPQIDGTEPDSAKKDQMELEMKQMIEKMRDYKAKDPSLFTQIWEQVKKSQPPQRAPSQSLQGSATSPIVVNGQLPSPSLMQSQLPPESDLPEGDEFPPGFDRGRFPAQRRRRGGSMKVPTSRKSVTPKGSTEPAAGNHFVGNHESPVPPEIAIPTPKVGQIFPDPGSQSMQQAMQQFQQNSKSPVVKAQQKPGSSTQATTNTSTRPTKVTALTAPPSQPVPAQPAPPPKPGGTYWPESKKKSLAEAARIALTSAPPNQAKTITTQEIHELLDQNPSYNQMCEILEYRGFVIDRGQFARVLLKAVPDLGSASTSANAASSSTASATRATPTNTTPTVTASNDNTDTTTTKATSATPTAGSIANIVKATSNESAAQTNKPQPLPYSVPPAAAFQARNGYATPYAPTPPNPEQASEGNRSNGFARDYRFVNPASWTINEPRHFPSVPAQGRPNEPALHSHLPLSHYQQPGPINGQVLDQNGAIHPNGFVHHHPTKREMARKRSFGEIVDLTQMLSDDEELERHKQKPRIDNEVASGTNKSVKNIFNLVAQRQQNIGRTTPKPFKYKYSGRDALLQSYDIVEPIYKRRDALRRSTYNPKTIARDFLLSLGKHPTMAPLNAHLDGLRERFKAVDYESDLSTFRWDLVDPEGEANAETFDTDDEVVPAVAVTRQRPAPLAVMVAGDGGDKVKDDQAHSRTLDPKGKPYKRGPYKKSGIRSGIQPIGSADTPQRQSSEGPPRAQNVGSMMNTNTADLSRFAYNSPSTAQTDLTTLNASSSSTPGSVTKRKGRPPGAKNKQVRPDKGIPKKTKTLIVGQTPSAAKAKTSDKEIVGNTPPVGNFSVGKPSAPIPTATPSTPSGLRHSISVMTPTDGIAVVIPSRSPSVVIVTPQASAKKGETKKAEDLSNGTRSSAPSYTMYRCRWENCPAELHSLETLKKHVRKHRRAIDDVYPCLWADCSDSSNPISNNTQTEDGQHRRLKFKTDEEWVKHVGNNHLRTKWELLQEASVKPSDVESSDRLSENKLHDRQATSEAKGPAVPVSPVQDDNELDKMRAEFNAH